MLSLGHINCIVQTRLCCLEVMTGEHEADVTKWSRSQITRSKARTKRMTDKHAAVIWGHGSRDELTVEEFNSLAFHLRNCLPAVDIESSFLEFVMSVIRTDL